MNHSYNPKSTIEKRAYQITSKIIDQFMEDFENEVEEERFHTNYEMNDSIMDFIDAEYRNIIDIDSNIALVINYSDSAPDGWGGSYYYDILRKMCKWVVQYAKTGSPYSKLMERYKEMSNSKSQFLRDFARYTFEMIDKLMDDYSDYVEAAVKDSYFEEEIIEAYYEVVKKMSCSETDLEWSMVYFFDNNPPENVESEFIADMYYDIFNKIDKEYN